LAAETEEDLKKLPKAEQMKRAKEKMRRKGDPGAPPSEEKDTLPTDYSTYSVLAFKLHKFDVTGKFKVTDSELGLDALPSDQELMKDALVMEMY
jgi:hypothetical protein